MKDKMVSLKEILKAIKVTKKLCYDEFEKDNDPGWDQCVAGIEILENYLRYHYEVYDYEKE